MQTPAAEYPVEVAEEVAQGFVASYFGVVDLGHKSRNRCFQRVAQQISRHPGGTLPDLSVVAAMLLNLRQAARPPDAHEREATAVVEPIYEEVLRGWRYRHQRDAMSVYEFYMAVARLGGHMNRKADGFPGWLTLWRGWQKLESMVEGVKIDRQRRMKNRVQR